MQTASFQKQKELRKIYTQEKTHHNNTEIIQQIPKHPKAETTQTTRRKFQTWKFQSLLLTHTCTRAPTAETQDFQKQIDLPSYINILLHTHTRAPTAEMQDFQKQIDLPSYIYKLPKADISGCPDAIQTYNKQTPQVSRVSRCRPNMLQTNT
jgi:lantibiotic modifying enzyme